SLPAPVTIGRISGATRSVQERAARRRDGARVRIARARPHRCPAFVSAVRRRQLLALTSVPLLILVPLRIIVFWHAAPDHPRHGRAGARPTVPRPNVHALLAGTVGRALLITISLPGVGHAAHDVRRWRRRRTGVREAGPRTHVRPVRGGAVGR